MHIAAATAVPQLDQYQFEWTWLCTRPHNVLLEGPSEAVDAVLLQLQRHIGEPIVGISSRAPLPTFTGTGGTLILKDVDSLSVQDQAQLLVWLGGAGLRTQVVSTTDRPLFGRVVSGHFDRDLYYRLNGMLLKVDEGPPASRNTPGAAVALEDGSAH